MRQKVIDLCGDAVLRALRGTGPAIVASAGTVAAGLALMCLAQFKVFSTAGPAVATSVVVSCIASLTLTPALAYLTGPTTFWPRLHSGRPGAKDRSGRFWNRLAAFTVRRPLLILVIGLAVLAPLAVYGWSQEVVYDTLADLPADRPSVRGAEMFRRHFPRGEMSPVRVLVRTEQPLGEADWARVAMAVDARLKDRPRVQETRSLVHPLGRDKWIEVRPLAFRVRAEFSADLLDEGKDNVLKALLNRRLRRLFAEEVAPRYIARDCRAALWEVAIDLPSYSNQALNELGPLADAIGQAVESVPAAAQAAPRVMLAGDTAQMRDVRQVTDRDFWVVGGLVVGAIILIVVLLIRDLPVALFVMVATILTYGAALGLTAWGFRAAFGTPGPDWKVEFFLFVILVAVGQDYNLFMLTRIVEERRFAPLRAATGSAIARTGAIISCCGLIMAATLGSLASSPLRLLQELGAAFVIGLLLDTFLVRPLMVPAFVLLFRRMDREGATAAAAPADPVPRQPLTQED